MALRLLLFHIPVLWLKPEIDVISRDRGGEYAAAARKGAPQAQQIADKFHLLKNLRDGLKELMARKQKVLYCFMMKMICYYAIQ